jgi:hypothetical protein
MPHRLLAIGSAGTLGKSRLRIPVAIQVVNLSADDSAAALQAARAQVVAHARCQVLPDVRPHTLRLHGFQEVPGKSLRIVTEMPENCLADCMMLAPHGRMPPREAVRFPVPSTVLFEAYQ